MNLLLICLRHGQILAAMNTQAQGAHSLPIHEEHDWFALRDASELKRAVKDIQERIDLPFKARLDVCLVYDEASAAWLDHFSTWRGSPDWPWQWLRWERLAARLGEGQGEPPTPAWVRQQLMSAVLDSLRGQDVQASGRIIDMDELELLRARCAELEREHAALCIRLRDLRPLSDEHLLTFLPALYQQAFSILSGADLAALIGRVEPFNIPSPYQELGGDPLHRKQREFLALPREQQRQIIDFAQGASRRLRLRQEMQAHVQALENG